MYIVKDQTSAGFSEIISRRQAGPDREVLIGGLVAVALVCSWLVLIHNRYLTVHEGWFSYYGWLMKNGKMPYRDFYFFTQPVHLLISRFLVGLGDKLIYFRYYGLAERVVLTAALYYLLSREFSAVASVCGTVASSFLLLAYETDALFSYLYTSLVFIILAVVCLQQGWNSVDRRGVWMMLAGVSASLAFFTKQSNGLLATVAIILIILFLTASIRRAIADVLAFGSGFVAAGLPFIWWIAHNGAWNSYLYDVFLGAAASKGGFRAILLGFIIRQTRMVSVVCFGGLAAAFLVLNAKGKLSFARGGRGLQPAPGLALGAIALAICAVIASVRRVGPIPVFVMRYTSRTIVEILLYTLVSVLVVVVWQFVRQSDREAMYSYRLPIALLMISAFWTYASGMSWAVEEQSVIPSLALGLAFAYDRIQLGRRRMMSVIVLTATVSVVTLAVWQKWSCAFNWEGWRQPITVDGYHSRWSPISDYKLDRADAEMYDAIFDDVQKYTRPGEEIVTFPTIPMFNFVGHHPQPGFAPVHEWDVCPDEIARRDAERMMAMKPRVIVNLRYNDWLLEFQDKGFRGGHKSGQREFQDNIDKLAASGEYRLTRRYLTPFYQMKLSVWVRE